MSTLEERVRAAARAAADTVAPDSLPPLHLPAGDAGRSRGGSRSSASVWARRLAPLGAALAVVALAVVVVNLSHTVRHAPAPGSRPAPAASGGMTAGPSLASYVASGLVPAYYVSIDSNRTNRSPAYAVVHSTATGAALGTIMAAGGGTIVAATAAGDDKTFVLAEQPWVPPQSHADQLYQPLTFVLFRLGASGQPGALTRLPVSTPSGALMTGLALSPDGSQLAIAVEPSNVSANAGREQVRLYSLRTGAARTWSASGTIGSPDDTRSLSWTADERTLAFIWLGNSPGVHLSVRLLNLRAGGSNLLADSRQAASLVDQGPPTVSPSRIGSPPTCGEDAIITPAATRIVCGAIAALSGGTELRQPAETEFLEFSASTGSVTRILGHWTFGNVSTLAIDVLWSNASGSVLVGVIPDAESGRVGVIQGNEFTPLPTSSPPVSPEGEAW
jgi:hypothetical protein